jgi:uncharacterized protein (DUF1015 family)
MIPLIRPFAALRPQPQYAAQVAAPPYDVVSTAEARQLTAGRLWSFLHVSRPEIDLPEATDPYSPEVYVQGAANLGRMRETGVLVRDERPFYYVYRLTMGTHVQTGLVAAASVAAYESGRIMKHELTRPDKEDDRVRHIEALNAQTGPVLLVYPFSSEVDKLLRQVMAGPPVYDLEATGAVRHTLWVVRDEGIAESITRAFDAMQHLYIADGHHRSAAAARVAARRRAVGREDTPEPAYEYFLTVSFPHTEMQILPYHRLVRDLNGLSVSEFLDKVREHFTVEQSRQAIEPGERGRFGMYLAGQWYLLTQRPDRVLPSDPVERLDVSLLSRYLLEPVLSIHDPRRSHRIDFVGGIRGVKELQRRVDSGEMAAAFALSPTHIEELMAVADAGELMPPKSTWFEPKLADGLVSHVLD